MASRSSCCRSAARRGGRAELGQRQGSMACAGRANIEGLRQWASSGATCGAALEQEVASGGAARRPAAALLRGRGEAEEEEGEGAPGAEL
jgi:hypothetical protein